MPERDKPIIAAWEVSGEIYDHMIQEAESDAIMFMRNMAQTGFEWQVEVLNCEPMEWEDARIIKWKGKAIIS